MPHGVDEALFIGSRDGAIYNAKVPSDGLYTIRVYQLGATKSENKSSNYTLRIQRTGQPRMAALPDRFPKKLSLKGVTFQLGVLSTSNGRVLKVTPSGLKSDNSPSFAAITGIVTNAEIADINGDGAPEIYVYSRKFDEKMTAHLLAWSSNANKSLSRIFMPNIPLSDLRMTGFQGHGEYSVVGKRLTRRFPIAAAGSHANRLMREFEYSLQKGENSWVFQVERVFEF